MSNIETNFIYKLLNEDVRDSLIEFLDVNIPYQGNKGWENHIINALSSFQKSRGYLQQNLQALDLAELLSVMQYNWSLLANKYGFSRKDKDTLARIRTCRNDSAHFNGLSEEDRLYELSIILDFLKMIRANPSLIDKINQIIGCEEEKKEDHRIYLFVNTGIYQGDGFYFSPYNAKRLIENRDFLLAEELIDLALCYEFGIGTPINLDKAFSILSTSSTGRGLYHAGRFLLNHKDITPDSQKKAFQYFRKSALEKYHKAYSTLSYCYFNGIGVKTDLSEVLHYAKLGEEVNEPTSIRYLGLLAEQQYFVPKEKDFVPRCYSKSFELGDVLAGYFLAKNYSTQNINAKAKEVMEKALPLLRDYSNDGDVIATYDLGVIYKYSSFWESDFRSSYKYFLKATEFGYPPAFAKTGDCYWKGEGTAVDKQEAIKWYKQGLNENNIDCCQILGKILLEGCKEAEVEPDYIEAEQCFDRIIDNDPESAYLNKGILHLKMHFCDYPGYHAEQAFSFFQKGLEAGSTLCSYYLGLCYLFEIGTEIDNKKAKELFNKAYSDNPFNANIAYPVVIIPADIERSDILLHGLAGYSNDVLAKYILGEKLLKSTLDTDKGKGLLLMQEAAEQGLSIAENYLGEYFEKSDQEKSLRFYEEATNNGFAPSLFNLGRVFEEGKIVKKDNIKAKEYYTSASQNGCKAADHKLQGIKTEEEIYEEFKRYKSKLRKITILGGLFFQYFSDTYFMKFMDKEAIEKESTNIASLCSSLSSIE